jgi:hypothetical protein
MATRDYYRDRRIKREEIVAREFLKKAVRELYIEQEDRNKAKVHLSISFLLTHSHIFSDNFFLGGIGMMLSASFHSFISSINF